ncbi:MAG TPA: TIGR03560 family F420-dependent LLM class oxidoreductase [Solirubrobacteraceae bacterium]|nr:TIGR03560 family F420-dependent LLM class oxidoreductase [Solirubrobacteraceae bacterium]
MRVCLMIEGQEGVSWGTWVALAEACERLGFEALFRSDHYLSVDGHGDRGSLDAWATVCGLGAVTQEVRLGTLVSPATFRHPSVLAKNVVSADHISGGRVELGLGTGWLEDEHTAYGFPFPPLGERMEILGEQLEIVRRSWAAGAFDFTGAHYRVERLDARPKPVQRPHPRLLVGGSAGPRSAALAARWADEYNTLYVTPERARERRSTLDRACEGAGRDPATLHLSMMNAFLIGADRDDLRARAQRLADWRGDADQARGDVDAYIGALDPWIVGAPEEFVDRLREYEAAGIERVMLQHHLFEDFDALELIGREVIPALAT